MISSITILLKTPPTFKRFLHYPWLISEETKMYAKDESL